MSKVKIEGMEWDIEQVKKSHKSKAAFVDAMTADADVYPRRLPEQRAKCIELVADVIFPVKPAGKAVKDAE